MHNFMRFHFRLRSIARSNTEAQFKEEVEKLKETQAYNTNNSFRNWVDRYWLPEYKVIFYVTTIGRMVKEH